MIEARKEAGVDNQSKIISQKAYDNGYVTIVQGSKRISWSSAAIRQT